MISQGSLHNSNQTRPTSLFLSFKWNGSVYIYPRSTYWPVRIMLLIRFEACPMVPGLFYTIAGNGPKWTTTKLGKKRLITTSCVSLVHIVCHIWKEQNTFPYTLVGSGNPRINFLFERFFCNLRIEKELLCIIFYNPIIFHLYIFIYFSYLWIFSLCNMKWYRKYSDSFTIAT